MRRASVELGLPEDFSPEYRESVIEHLKATPTLRDDLYETSDGNGDATGSCAASLAGRVSR